MRLSYRDKRILEVDNFLEMKLLVCHELCVLEGDSESSAHAGRVLVLCFEGLLLRFLIRPFTYCGCKGGVGIRLSLANPTVIVRASIIPNVMVSYCYYIRSFIYLEYTSN